ncbi:hypothetical protein DES53_107216 [Roseimicrobium gellanilyticum]|uniref:Uncharacterized protein n=1 Tax=Roseimicrobium gellanilyticum TaxID=748857 RepID=A0A366HFN9_9BACT|nr:hypothetical protein DES53_107216 [Roseimicrobium gellanilyticum]
MHGPPADDALRDTYNWLDCTVNIEIVKDDGVTVTRSEESTMDTRGRRARNCIISRLST